MLQITPEDEKKPDTDEATDDAIYCAGCGHLITRGRWRTAVDGHEHVFFNPAGRVFRILLFSEAPGALGSYKKPPRFRGGCRTGYL